MKSRRAWNFQQSQKWELGGWWKNTPTHTHRTPTHSRMQRTESALHRVLIPSTFHLFLFCLRRKDFYRSAKQSAVADLCTLSHLSVVHSWANIPTDFMHTEVVSPKVPSQKIGVEGINQRDGQKQCSVLWLHSFTILTWAAMLSTIGNVWMVTLLRDNLYSSGDPVLSRWPDEYLAFNRRGRGREMAKDKLTQAEWPFVGPLLSSSGQQLFKGNWHE